MKRETEEEITLLKAGMVKLPQQMFKCHVEYYAGANNFRVRIYEFGVEAFGELPCIALRKALRLVRERAT